MRALRRFLMRLAASVARRPDDDRLREELEQHVALQTAENVRAGLSPVEARRQAVLKFGAPEAIKERCRDEQRLPGLSNLVLDYKLGVRMLVKYPGLTLTGGLALAIAIGIGAGWYDFSRQMSRPTIPLPDGERLVQFDAYNALTNDWEPRLLHDFVGWRRDLRSVEDLGAYRTIARALTLANVRTDPVLFAETTASAFRVARVPPLLGRALVDADERPGATSVIVLGYGVWQRWFDGRADAVGQHVQVGRATATVVGVMPEGFSFPVSHQAWVPLNASGYAPLEGGAISVFGRLAPGVSQREAVAELAALVARAAAESPETHAHLRLDLNPYGRGWFKRFQTSSNTLFEYVSTHLPILLVLLVACTTVGTLVYARTATREAEIAVRSALGAGRRRIVMQLFVEALVLASAAAVVGLAAAHVALTWGVGTLFSVRDGGPPFWIHPGLRLTTVLYATLLAVVAAGMCGILPALRATGSHVQGHLRNLGSGGSTLRFGGVWTTLMILQVAVTVICIPLAIGGSEETVRDRIIRGRFPAGEYLSVPIELDRGSGLAVETESAFAERLERTYGEFERRIGQEPGVVAVTFADRLPGVAGWVRRAQVEPLPGAATPRALQIRTSAVGPGFFEAFGRPILAGRGFDGGDRAPDARTVIVNEAFVRRFMNGVNPLGRRVRYASDDPDAASPWFEIVGIARDIGMTPTRDGEAPYLFHAASPGSVRPAVMGVRVKGDPAMLAPRVRAIAGEVDPGLRLGDVRRLDDVVWRADISSMVGSAALVGIVGVCLFCSAAGIFSLMSVTVARQTREIGLRVALGASPGRLLRSIFSRAAVLVGGGVAAGNLVLPLVGLVFPMASNGVALLIPSAVMMIAGVLACVGPARRALRINPADALKDA